MACCCEVSLEKSEDPRPVFPEHLDSGKLLLYIKPCHGSYALHKTELLYTNLAKSLKLAPFWCSYPLRQSPTGEVEKMI